MSMKRDVEFIYELGMLRFVDRAWKQFFGGNLQNVSEHSFRVIFTALMIARLEKAKLNEAKLIKMAMIHDLAESRTGDLHYQSRRYCERDEKRATKDMFVKTVFEKDFLDLLNEYEERKCLEAKIVKDADNLDVDIEMKENTSRGMKLPRTWRAHRKTVYKELYTASAKKLSKALESADPHDWHMLGRNRFNSGDWKE